MTPSIEQQRKNLLPRLAEDRRDLDHAVDEVRVAGAEALRRGAALIFFGLGMLVAIRYVFRWAHGSE